LPTAYSVPPANKNKNLKLYAEYGKDTAGLNFGKDIFKSYETRFREYDNTVGQGLKTNLYFVDFNAGYFVNSSANLHFYLGYRYRNEKNDEENQKLSYFYVGIRTSIENFYYDF
jgi:hypothetical protein